MNEHTVAVERSRPADEVQTLRWNLESATGAGQTLAAPGDIRDRIRSSEALPPLPEITRRLLELRADPDANALMLAEAVGLDPMLSAQLLRWANSPYYAPRNPVSTVRDAIVRALGFNLSFSLALGLAALSPLKTPNTGPLGRDRIWRHGMQCATLMQALAREQPAEIRPASGLIELAGVTQNIGYLLLGHLLPEHFQLLGRFIQSNPGLALPTLERFAIGVEHTQLGGWLFEAWEMPEALQTVQRQHHNPAYSGEHQSLVLLTCLADQLLEGRGDGLGARPSEPETRTGLLERLGLGEHACEHALAALADCEEEDNDD